MPYTKELHRLLAAMDAVQEDDEDLPVQQLRIFFAIGLRPGISSADLLKITGTSQASISRNVAALSEWHRLGKAGLNLVEAVSDPAERRRKIHFLTPRGQRRLEKVLTAFTGHPVKYDAATARQHLHGIHKSNLD